jgi:SAM-dependent methyltransferase
MKKQDSFEEFEYFGDADIDRIQNNYMGPIFEDIIKKYRFESILDYGCGNGLFGGFFKEKIECKLTGIDGSSYALKKASERGYDRTILIKDFSRADLPFEDSSFDLVICKDILEHLLNPIKVIQESHRVLSQSGKLLIHVPNHFPLLDRIKFLFTKNIDTQSYFPDANDWNFPHIRFFSFQGLVGSLEQAGFEIIGNYSFHFARVFGYFHRLPFMKNIFTKLACWSPDNFSAGFSVLLKKKD